MFVFHFVYLFVADVEHGPEGFLVDVQYRYLMLRFCFVGSDDRKSRECIGGLVFDSCAMRNIEF